MQFTTRLCLAAFAGLTLSRAAAVEPLETVLSDTNAWTEALQPSAARLAPLGFRPVGQGIDGGLRARNGAFTAFGRRPVETLARYDRERLQAVDVFFFTRGDSGDLARPQFAAAVAELRKSVEAWAGRPGLPQRTENRGTTARIERMVWVRAPHRVDLEWSYTEERREEGATLPFRPEYIRLRWSRYDPSQQAQMAGGQAMSARTAAAPGTVLTAMALRGRIERRPAGDVVIRDVPMVDQGDKGYCVAATTERLLRYFGRELGQHELAQLANSEAEGGTDTSVMVEALRKMSKPLRIRVEELMPDTKTYIQDNDLRIRLEISKSQLKTIREYNRVARKAREPEMSDKEIIQIRSQVGYLERMKPPFFREARLGMSLEKDKFQKDIQRHVESGVPLAWTLMVGVIPEKDVEGIQGYGGHMRIIHGFNPKTKEVIYTDSWGAGHEEKRMSLDDAWVASTGLYAILPQELRL